jgi:thiol-disulfide isomerase/thioredoxin|tara:strand:- start:91 stop:1479 length:1389 start_codon:yes stop_codon:yes gene_type:complete
MKTLLNYLLLCFLTISFTKAQTISGNLFQLTNQEIRLESFNGLNTYSISKTVINEKGEFELSYTTKDRGVGYLMSADKKPLFVILSGEDIQLKGEALSFPQSISITKGEQNKNFEQYAVEQPKREQALSAWVYLQKMYAFDSLFALHSEPIKAIEEEQQRIKTEEETFLNQLPKESYVRWFLPTRKLVSLVSTVVQYRPEEIPETLAAFRQLDYTDKRLYKSGLFKDAIESHFWLIENSGKSLDSVFVEMKRSIDVMLEDLIKDEKILNEVTDFLFDLLERHSLFEASEYLALKVLNETSCTLNSDLANQLESYRAMKKGNIAPDIEFTEVSYLNGTIQSQFSGIYDFTTPYTLVVFGASTCSKCMEELPKIGAQYANWRNAGLEVLYVSLDTDKTEYKQKVRDYPFFTYCDFEKWEGKVVQDYYVFGTPTYFILDKKREIILRPNSVKQIDAWVKWFLKKE